MAKKKELDNMSRLNRIHPVTNFFFNLLFVILALACFLPIIFILIISLTSNDVIRREGYQLWLTAENFSADAYVYLWGQRATILRALWVSVEVTVIGTVLGVMLTCMMGYVLSRQEHKLNNFLTILIFIPMVFGGGMAASYVVNTQILHLRDTLWVLILPLLVSSVSAFPTPARNCTAPLALSTWTSSKENSAGMWMLPLEVRTVRRL